MAVIPFRRRVTIEFDTPQAHDTIMGIQRQWGDKSIKDMFLSGSLLLHQCRTFLKEGYQIQLTKDGRAYAFEPDVEPK